VGLVIGSIAGASLGRYWGLGPPSQMVLIPIAIGVAIGVAVGAFCPMNLSQIRTSSMCIACATAAVLLLACLAVRLRATDPRGHPFSRTQDIDVALIIVAFGVMLSAAVLACLAITKGDRVGLSLGSLLVAVLVYVGFGFFFH